MRIVKGGMVLRSIGPNQYTVKDEPAVGVQIQQMPLRLTKDALYQILSLNKVPFNRNDKKKSLEAQLFQMYALHPTQNSKHIIYEKGRARLKPKVKSEVPELAYEKLYKAKPVPRTRNPMKSKKKPKPFRLPVPSRPDLSLLTEAPVIPPRYNDKTVNLDEPPPLPPRNSTSLSRKGPPKPPRPTKVAPPLPPRNPTSLSRKGPPKPPRPTLPLGVKF